MGSCLSASDRRQGSPRSPSSIAGMQKLTKSFIKKQGLRCSSSFSSKRDELQRIPGRMFVNGSSSMASLCTKQGKKGINQDAMLVWENFGSKKDVVFCGIFDGHGPFGHMVSRKVRDCLPLKLISHFDANVSSKGFKKSSLGTARIPEDIVVFSDEATTSLLDSEVGEKPPEFFFTLKEAFLKAFRVMDKELRLHPTLDCFCSGTTAVTLIKQGQDLVIGNVGDSRAVLGTRNIDGHLTATQLTVDFKPNLPMEEERIKRCRGRVFALKDEPEVARVWLPNNNSPGLAMARAFGDFCLKDFGLIAVPEIFYRRLTKRDEFIVLATDGIWDVLSNNEVVEVVSSAPNRSYAARFLVESAIRAWKQKFPSAKVDDCAVVCLFLDTHTLTSYCDTKEVSEVSDFLGLGSEAASPSSLERSDTVRSTCSEPAINSNVKEFMNHMNKSQSARICTDSNETTMTTHDKSGLENVSRVTTLLTVPRFAEARDKPLAEAALEN